MEPILIDKSVVELWWHYEQVAMHFNQLIIQYRLQVMAGVGVIGAVSSYIVVEKIHEPEDKHRVRAIISSLLLLLIIAAAFLDLAYYNELLRGSVNAILKLENQYSSYLYMSTEIRNEFKFFGAAIPSYVTVGIVYLIIIFPLSIFTRRSWALWQKDTSKTKKSDKKHKASEPTTHTPD